MEIISVNIDKCVGCNACIRSCPATEAIASKILDDGRAVTAINENRCIKCGKCLSACIHGAREFSDDTDDFFDVLKKKPGAVILLVDPAIKATYNGSWRNVLMWFKQNGAKAIYDAALGADICTWAHLKAVELKISGKDIISSACPAVVSYIAKYQAGLVDKLSPVYSPMMCAAVYIRKVLNRSEPIAIISPCAAKIVEANVCGDMIEYSVTFEKMKRYFKTSNIYFQEGGYSAFEFDDAQGLVGSIYPRPGGLRDNLWMHNPDLNISVSSGTDRIYSEIDAYSQMNTYKHPEIFDVLSCEYGCNMGPACGSSDTIFDVMDLMRAVEAGTKKKRKTGLSGKGDKQFAGFDASLNINDFIRKHSKDKKTLVDPKESEVAAIFESMGKNTKEAKNFDCRACGYPTCRSMAVAIFKGLNFKENCVEYAKANIGSGVSGGVSEKEMEEISNLASRVSAFATNLLASVENISAATNEIRMVNSGNYKKTDAINGILMQVINFCGGAESISEENLDMVKTTLERLHSSLISLSKSSLDAVNSSKEIDEAVSGVANEATELNAIVQDMISHFAVKN